MKMVNSQLLYTMYIHMYIQYRTWLFQLYSIQYILVYYITLHSSIVRVRCPKVLCTPKQLVHSQRQRRRAQRLAERRATQWPPPTPRRAAQLPPPTPRRRLLLHAGAHCVDSFSDSSQQLLRGRFSLQPLRGCARLAWLVRPPRLCGRGQKWLWSSFTIRVNRVVCIWQW